MITKKFNKKYLIFFAALVIASIIVFAGIISLGYIKQSTYCGPGGCPDRTLRQTETPQYKEASGFSDDAGGTECSKPIRMVSYTINKKREYVNFRPVDPEEARVFCHITYAIEYKGKLTVLQKPEVLALIAKYPYKDVSIKALEFKYIQDTDFVNRLLPQYIGREIGCIIVLETPNEKLVYLEDENLNTFDQIDYKLFENNLANVSEVDRKLFLDNLK